MVKPLPHLLIHVIPELNMFLYQVLWKGGMPFAVKIFLQVWPQVILIAIQFTNNGTDIKRTKDPVEFKGLKVTLVPKASNQWYPILV